MKKVLFLILTAFGFSYATLFILPEEVLKENFPNAVYIKKNILLMKSQHKKIEKITKTKFTSNIFTAYIIKKDSKTIGYALLHSHKVRTKNEVILVSFDKNCNVLDIELIAFYEPPEYIPSEKWRETFENKNIEKQPVLKKNIPNITGATLSTRAMTDGVRQAIGICEVALKGRY